MERIILAILISATHISSRTLFLRDNGNVSLNHGQWVGKELVASVDGTAVLTVLPSLFSPSEVKQLRSALAEYDSSFVNSMQDSIDGLPAFEKYITRPRTEPGVKDLHALRPMFRPFVEQRIEPYIRNRYDCPTCTACHWLVRRYRDGERRAVAPHFDAEGYVTAVVDLSLQSYEGGLQVMDSQGNKSTQQMVALGAGDAVFHTFNLQHSVNVSRGERWSLVLWFDDVPLCTGATQQWYSQAARAGDVVAQYHLAVVLRNENPSAARDWLSKSAAGGVDLAQIDLGIMMVQGEGGPADFSGGLKWIAAAAEKGNAAAAYNMGSLLRDGGDSFPPNKTEAIKWFKIAAAQNDASAASKVARAYFNGDQGVGADTQEAIRWVQKAAELHDIESQFLLAQILLEGEEVDQDIETGQSWLRRAAAHGHPDAAQMLADVSHMHASRDDGL